MRTNDSAFSASVRIFRSPSFCDCTLLNRKTCRKGVVCSFLPLIFFQKIPLGQTKPALDFHFQKEIKISRLLGPKLGIPASHSFTHALLIFKCLLRSSLRQVPQHLDCTLQENWPGEELRRGLTCP